MLSQVEGSKGRVKCFLVASFDVTKKSACEIVGIAEVKVWHSIQGDGGSSTLLWETATATGRQPQRQHVGVTVAVGVSRIDSHSKALGVDKATRCDPIHPDTSFHGAPCR
jgi:hypothetical protein